MHKRHKTSETICKLTFREWQNLIVPHLDLDALGSLRQTCTAFAKCKDIQNRIAQKTKEVFGDYPVAHWNKFAIIDARVELFHEKDDQRFYILLYTRDCCDPLLGFFSNKKRLVDAFKEIMRNVVHIEHITQILDKQRYEFKSGIHTLYINGFTQEEVKFISKLPAYQPRFEIIKHSL